MKRLIISNTHYQTIFAIQLKLTLFKDDEVVLIISDHSKNSEMVCENLKELNLFSEVCYVFSREILYSNDKNKQWKDFINFSIMKNNRYKFYLEKIGDCYFDEIISFNLESDIYGLYYILSEKNKEVKLSMMEEGIFTYSNKLESSKKLNLANNIRKRIKKENIYGALENFYCFYPQIYEGDFNAVGVPLINNKSECTSILRKIFNLKENSNIYDRKYIFFTSVFDFEGGKSIGEFELVKKTAELVGKANLIVKTHPRDRRTIYKENGFYVDINSSIPWEVIQLTYDFSSNVFLSATSGSVLSGSFMSENPIRTYYLYKLCDLQENEKARIAVNNINNLINNEKMKDIFKSVSMPERIEDIL